jgi:hypothetical protein
MSAFTNRLYQQTEDNLRPQSTGVESTLSETTKIFTHFPQTYTQTEHVVPTTETPVIQVPKNVQFELKSDNEVNQVHDPDENTPVNENSCDKPGDRVKVMIDSTAEKLILELESIEPTKNEVINSQSIRFQKISSEKGDEPQQELGPIAFHPGTFQSDSNVDVSALQTLHKGGPVNIKSDSSESSGLIEQIFLSNSRDLNYPLEEDEAELEIEPVITRMEREPPNAVSHLALSYFTRGKYEEALYTVFASGNEQNMLDLMTNITNEEGALLEVWRCLSPSYMSYTVKVLGKIIQARGNTDTVSPTLRLCIQWLNDLFHGKGKIYASAVGRAELTDLCHVLSSIRRSVSESPCWRMHVNTIDKLKRTCSEHSQK